MVQNGLCENTKKKKENNQPEGEVRVAVGGGGSGKKKKENNQPEGEVMVAAGGGGGGS